MGNGILERDKGMVFESEYVVGLFYECVCIRGGVWK